MRFKIPVLLQAVLVIAIAYIIFAYAFPPVLPKTLMIQFMIITVVGVLLYYSFDDTRWAEFKAPILAVLRRQGLWPLRWLLLIAVPSLVGYTVYGSVKPSTEAPVELRQVHPAPPSMLRVFEQSYDLSRLENPLRQDILAQWEEDRESAMEAYQEILINGREVYYQNCFYCHGDLLDGNGPFAAAFNPLPINFQDVGTIAQLQEAFLFWRITTGGPGLPKEGTPWNSAMPVWHELLDEDEVWSVITFLYDYVGQVPRMWDNATSKAVTGMKEIIQAQRAQYEGQALYQFRCAVCHGEEGYGDGLAADYLYPRPRDFSLGLFKYKTSPGTQLPRDQDLFDTIKFGLQGTGMPGWASVLSDAQIESLIPVIKSLDTVASWSPEDAEDEDFDDDGRYLKNNFVSVTDIEPSDKQVAYSPESVARGREVFDKTCNECHGDQGRGNITSGKRLESDWGYRIWPRDLTKPWTWRVSEISNADPVLARDETIQRIYQRLSIGIPGTPMPAHRAEDEDNEDPISLEERWHVANYVYSLREAAAPPPGQATLLAGVPISGELPASGDDPLWRQAPPITLALAPNIIKEERLFTPLADAVTARVLYNAEEIAFLLEVNDRTDSRPGEETSEQIQDEALELHSDAFAIQFPQEDAFATDPVVAKPLYRHGDSAHPTTIWYWNAGGIDPEQAPRTLLLDASGPNQALTPRNEDPSLSAAGQWQDGRWRVVMKRPRSNADSRDVEFREGRFIPISIANWDGSNGEVGSKHTLTTWYWLRLPPQVKFSRLYGTPTGVGALVFVAGLLLVRNQRRQEQAST